MFFVFMGGYLSIMVVVNGYYYYYTEVRDAKPIPHNRCMFDG